MTIAPKEEKSHEEHQDRNIISFQLLAPATTRQELPYQSILWTFLKRKKTSRAAWQLTKRNG